MRPLEGLGWHKVIVYAGAWEELELVDDRVKGNVDAELVLHSMIEFNNYDKALIVSGDGDFYCLVNYFIKREKLKKVLALNQVKYSCLLENLEKK